MTYKQYILSYFYPGSIFRLKKDKSCRPDLESPNNSFFKKDSVLFILECKFVSYDEKDQHFLPLLRSERENLALKTIDQNAFTGWIILDLSVDPSGEINKKKTTLLDKLFSKLLEEVI